MSVDSLAQKLMRFTMPASVFAGIVGCIFLFCVNPTEIGWMPRCPFYELTGYKCPGCGTLRGIHHLLHFRFAMAWAMNPFMIVSIPLITAFLVWPKLSRNVVISALVTVAVLLYWLLRNIVGW